MSFVKFVFFNVVGKKNSFAFSAIFDVYAIKNPPRAAWAFSSFSSVSLNVVDKKEFFAYFAYFDVYAIKNRPAQLGLFAFFYLNQIVKELKRNNHS